MLFFAVCFLGAEMLIRLFLKDGSPESVATGMSFLRIASPFYMVVVFKMITDGLLRGAGAIKSFTTATFSDLIIRVVLSYILSAYYGITGIWMSWPVGWAIGTAISLAFYAKGVWKPKK